MIVVYKVNNGKIWSISRQADNYQLQEGEYSSNTWFLKPSFNGSAVVESITQQEIDDRAEAAEQQEEEEIVRQRIKDGESLINLVLTKAKRRYKDGLLTVAQYKSIRSSVSDVLLPLKFGDWDIAQDTIAAKTPPVNETMLAVFNFIKNKIDQYVLDNY